VTGVAVPPDTLPSGLRPEVVAALRFAGNCQHYNSDVLTARHCFVILSILESLGIGNPERNPYLWCLCLEDILLVRWQGARQHQLAKA
jgi:hypothetical protein